MVDCNICKHREDHCIECKHGELFERNNVSEPKQISVSHGSEYCGHCGYSCEYATGYKKFYCIRCGGLNLRGWEEMNKMENKGCDACKYEHCDTQDYPCSKCSHSYIDKYKPKTNADKIRNMSDEELAEFLAVHDLGLKGNDSPMLTDWFEWLQSEAD